MTPTSQRAMLLLFLAIAAVAHPQPKNRKAAPQTLSVEVTITREDGRPVEGLKQQNFRVLADGAPQRISEVKDSHDRYVIIFEPANRAQNGNYRKIKVELVDDTGRPLKIKSEKGRDVRYQIVVHEPVTRTQ